LPSSFEGALVSFEVSPSFGYSWIFFGDPPGERGLRTVGIWGGSKDICENFTSHFDSPVPETSSVWMMQVYFTATTPGAYQIVVNPKFPSLERLASVTLEQWQDGHQVDQYKALGGSIQLESAAQDLPGWQANSRLVARVSAEFPTHHVRALGCNIGGGNGTQTSGSCRCQDETAIFDCVPTTANPDCCYDYQSERRTLSVALGANHCAAMCSVNSVLYASNCTDLRD
jgi:hypothetical protein